VDNRLGFFQKSFKLSGKEVRALAAEEPLLILWKGVPFQVNKSISIMYSET
jgi:hypothetical protein